VPYGAYTKKKDDFVLTFYKKIKEPVSGVGNRLLKYIFLTPYFKELTNLVSFDLLFDALFL